MSELALSMQCHFHFIALSLHTHTHTHDLYEGHDGMMWDTILLCHRKSRMKEPSTYIYIQYIHYVKRESSRNPQRLTCRLIWLSLDGGTTSLSDNKRRLPDGSIDGSNMHVGLRHMCNCYLVSIFESLSHCSRAPD